MRLLHTADLHLGSLRGLKTVSSEAKLRRYEAYLRAIFELAEKHECAAVVIAGDIFDHKNVRPKVRDILLRVLVDNLDMPVLMINGNHDLLEADYTSLHFLAELQTKERLPNLHLAECVPRVVHVAGAIFVLLPYIGDPEIFSRRAKELVGRAKKRAKGQPIVVVSHEMARGSSNDAGWTAKRSGVTLPKLKSVTYWAMGDIHKRQRVGKMRNAWYSGPPAQHNFGELPDKGVLIVDTNNPTRPHFVSLVHPDVPPLVNVEADDIEQVRAGLNAAPEGAWVNLRCTSETQAALGADDTTEATIVKSAPTPKQLQKAAEQTAELPSSSGDPLVDLEDYLIAHHGLSKDEADQAARLARNLL